MTYEAPSSLRAAITAIEDDAKERVAELLADQQALETKIAALAESKAQKQKREQRDAERAHAQAQLQARLLAWQGTFDGRSAAIGDWRNQSLSVIDAAENIPSEQDRHVTDSAALLFQAALDFRQFRAAFDSDQEFMLGLRDMLNDLSARIDWNLPIDFDRRKRYAIRNPSWMVPLGGDMRQAAIQRAMRAPMPPAPAAPIANGTTAAPPELPPNPVIDRINELDAAVVGDVPAETPLAINTNPARRKRRG